VRLSRPPAVVTSHRFTLAPQTLATSANSSENPLPLGPVATLMPSHSAAGAPSAGAADALTANATRAASTIDFSYRFFLRD
jgi:hypothetical protein